MKHASKFLVLLLTLAMLFSMLPAAVSAIDPALSADFNGTFLDGDGDGKADNWNLDVYLDDKPYPTYGGNYVKTIALKTNRVGTIPAPAAGEEVYIAGYVKGEKPRFYITFYDDAKAWKGELKPSFAASDEWIKIDQKIAWKDGATYATLAIGSNSTTADAYFADLTHYTKGDAPATPTPTPGTGELPDLNGTFMDTDADGSAENWKLTVKSDEKPYPEYTGNYVTITGRSPAFNSVAKIQLPAADEEIVITGYAKGTRPRFYITYNDASDKWFGEEMKVFYDLTTWTAVEMTLAWKEGAAIAIIGITGDKDAEDSSFADIKVERRKKKFLASITTWGNSEVPAAAITSVAGFDGRNALQVDLQQVTVADKCIAAILPLGTNTLFKPKTAYKFTVNYKVDDITQRPIIHFGTWHTSGNKDIYPEFATATDTWTSYTFYVVTPDTLLDSKIEVRIGGKVGAEYATASRMTVSDILVEEATSEVIFPATITSGAKATVNYVFAEGRSSVASPTAAKAVIALYKKDGEKKILCATKSVSTTEWTGDANWRQPAIVDAELTLPTLVAGDYEMKVMTFGPTGMSPLADVFTKTYTVE